MSNYMFVVRAIKRSKKRNIHVPYAESGFLAQNSETAHLITVDSQNVCFKLWTFSSQGLYSPVVLEE